MEDIERYGRILKALMIIKKVRNGEIQVIHTSSETI